MSKSSTAKNLPLDPALVTMVLPPGLDTKVATGMPSWVCPPMMASMPRTREAIFKSTSMPLWLSTSTTCAPLARTSSTMLCMRVSWMPNAQSATI